MADATHTQGFYRQQGGNRAVVASSGSLDVESGGEIDIEAGGRLEIGGTAFISSGGAIVLTSGITKGNLYTTGTVVGDSFSSTGGTAGTGKFNSITSTGIVAGDSFTSTGGTAGSGKFNSVTSTGTGTFNAVTSTGIVTGDSFTSTGGTVGSGKFNSVTSTGTGTFNAVTSTGIITGDSFTSTGGTVGSVKANSVTSTGTGTFNAVTSTGAVTGGLVNLLETVATTAATALSNYGISVLGSSSLTEDQTHTIAPVTGARKTFIVVSSVTSASVNVVTTGTWDGTNNKLTIATTSGATETRVDAVATSTARWRLLYVTASSNYSLATT